MTIQAAMADAMHRENADDAISALIEHEVWMVDVDTMTLAVHNVYCGIMADHEHPNDKDRDQARQLVAAVGRAIGAGGA
jgi:hypothetical protein